VIAQPHECVRRNLNHYQHVVSALAEPIRLMDEIDDAIDENGGWPIK
jgi:hypothetical protein